MQVGVNPTFLKKLILSSCHHHSNFIAIFLKHDVNCDDVTGGLNLYLCLFFDTES